MAMNQVNQVPEKQKKSALETFANITGMAMNLGNLGSNIMDMKKKGIDLNKINGTK